MSSPSVAQARSFIQHAVLPAAPRDLPSAQAAGMQSPFDAVKQQAAVAGSDVISFVEEISPEQRQDIVNASVLAQLVANKQLPQPDSLGGILDWYGHYFDVMGKIGFAVQSRGFTKYQEKADTFEAHEAIIDVVKLALGGAPAALPLVLKTLESLKSMSNESPWITLFHRESRSANTARFQVSVADSDSKGPTLNVLAFGLEARAEVTQVLFFKFRKNESTLQHNSSQMSINPTVLAGIRDDVAQKILRFSREFVAGLDI